MSSTDQGGGKRRGEGIMLKGGQHHASVALVMIEIVHKSELYLLVRADDENN